MKFIIKPVDENMGVADHIQNLQAIGNVDIKNLAQNIVVIEIFTRGQEFELEKYCRENNLRKFGDLKIEPF